MFFFCDVYYGSGPNTKSIFLSRGCKLQVKLSAEKFPDSLFCIKDFFSAFKLIAYIQHKDHSLPWEKCFLLFASFQTKHHPQNCCIRFLIVHQLSCRFILRTRGHLLDSSDRISSKLTFRLCYHNLEAFFRQHYRHVLGRNSPIFKLLQECATIRSYQRMLEW